MASLPLVAGPALNHVRPFGVARPCGQPETSLSVGRDAPCVRLRWAPAGLPVPGLLRPIPFKQHISKRRCAATPEGKRGSVFESYEDLTDTQPEPEVAVLAVACATGLVTGTGVVLFNWSIHSVQDVLQLVGPMAPMTLSKVGHVLPEPSAWPLYLLAPAVGGLAVGGLRLAMDRLERRQADGPGFDAADWAEAARARGRAALVPLLRAGAAAVTLGTGNSLGPEGPSVDIGRSSARGLGDLLLRSGPRHLTSLLAAGSAAGVAAGFNAPISGVFFAIETVLAKRRAKGDVLEEEAEDDSGLTEASLLLSSVIAAVVSRAGLGNSPAFRVPEYALASLYELPLYCGLGALCGVTAITFVTWSTACTAWFDRVREEGGKVDEFLLPAAGGLVTGALSLAYPEIMYQGFENVNRLLRQNGEYGITLLLEIVAIKVFATGVSKASGLVGGLYAPSIFLGAALGSAFGDIGHVLIDTLAHEVPGANIAAPQAYALVGVAAMLAAICQVPLTAVLLLFELTQDYQIIIPTLAAVGISFWLSTLLRKTLPLSWMTRKEPAPAPAPPLPAMVAPLYLQLDDARPAPNGAAGNGATMLVESVASRSCVVLTTDMSVEGALAALEAGGEAGCAEYGVLVAPDGAPIGVVSRAMLLHGAALVQARAKADC